MKKIFTTAIAALLTLGAQAQLVTSDATWCDAIERAFESQGINANVNCDVYGYEKVLRVAVGGKTASISLKNSAHADYSSNVCICVEPLAERHFPRELDVRVWPLKSSNNRVDDVFMDPNDDAYLFDALQGALTDIPRVKVVDGYYADQAINETGQLMLLRCNVLNMLRGERFVAAKGNAQPTKKRPEVERRLAYLEVNLQLVDYRTGEIVWQKRVQADDYTTLSYTDPMETCRNRVTRELTSFLKSAYPSVAPRVSVEGEVTQLVASKKDKAETVYINLGSDNRVKKGDTFVVYRQLNVGGNIGKEKIGTVSVSEVRGATLALCKVKKGDKDIYAALMNGELLIVESEW